ncbi:MAG: hypothetical protein P1U68_08885 [Verrucomicrobiales bacterium]|nr:hypothetical protein [Verrucomicrobiales bacterium]
MQENRPVISFRDLIASEYFAVQKDAFAQAVEKLGREAPEHYHLAGTYFTLHCAGSLTRNKWFRAIDHLRVPDAGPDSWDIYAWDDAEAGWTWRLPEPYYTYGGQTCHWPKISSDNIRIFHQDWLGIHTAMNRENREAYYVPAHTGSMPTCERAAPLRTILNFLLNENCFQMVHAAAISDRSGKSLLLPGEGGSGKSTTATAWLTAGNSYQGDDLCAIGGGDIFETIATYQSAKLRKPALARFPSLDRHLEHINELGEEKALLHADSLGENRVAYRANLVGILLPTVTLDERTKLTPAKPIEVMKAVIPQSMLQVPRSDNRGGKILLKVISMLPAWHLHLGTDQDHLLKTLEESFSLND